MKAVDTKLYRAKATFPVGNSWESGWKTKEEAVALAKWFCSTWAVCLVRAEATVFYRDGSAVCHEANEVT